MCDSNAKGVLMSKINVRAKLFRLLFMISFVVCVSGVRAEANATDQTIVLWPEGAPGALGKTDNDIPTITPYLPDPATATGAATSLDIGAVNAVRRRFTRLRR